MKTIVQIYRKLLGFFSKNQTKPKVTTDTRSVKEDYIGHLSFSLTKTRDIDIVCTFPDLSKISADEIKSMSEIYAEFLLYINEGLLKDDILHILETKDHNNNLTEDQQAKDRMFIDNVMFNWALLHVENLNRKKQSKKDNQPLIRPISVFNAV